MWMGGDTIPVRRREQIVEMQFWPMCTWNAGSCHGKRFKDEVLEVTYNQVNIRNCSRHIVDETIEFFNQDEKW